uniref:Apolipoprotein D n=1 Tax=Schizaphis graminum TaxID=13262 RepID=A0A2S2PG53_SCHGA
MACFKVVKVLFCIIIGFSHSTLCYKLSKNDEMKCPEVRARSNCDLDAIKGAWNVIEYYASSEEVEIYRCMRSTFNLSPDTPEISMDFTYSYADDPDNEMLTGNITWNIPSFEHPGHWVHMETPYEGVYNTFVLDCKDTWAVLLHCAEKPSSPRYLSSILLSRDRTVPVNVRSYVHDKLPKYGVQLEYTFPMVQDDCSPAVIPLYYGTKTASDKKTGSGSNIFKHPMLHNDRSNKQQTEIDTNNQ